MPDPEDYVDAPADSPRAKLERKRKGASQYGAIPEAVKKDPVGTAGLLLAAAGVPELKAGTATAKSVVATGEKAGGIANKLTRFGRHDDPTTQLAQGGATLKTGLDEAQKAGENKANEKRKPKMPGASSGALIAKGLSSDGFDLGAPQQSTNMGDAIAGGGMKGSNVRALGQAEGAAMAPVGGSAGSLDANPKFSFIGTTGGGGGGGGGGTGRMSRTAGTGDPLTQAMAQDAAYRAQGQQLMEQAMNAANGIANPRPTARNSIGGAKKGGVVVPPKKLTSNQMIHHGLHAMKSGGIIKPKRQGHAPEMNPYDSPGDFAYDPPGTPDRPTPNPNKATGNLPENANKNNALHDEVQEEKRKKFNPGFSVKNDRMNA